MSVQQSISTTTPEVSEKFSDAVLVDASLDKSSDPVSSDLERGNLKVSLSYADTIQNSKFHCVYIQLCLYTLI